MEFRLKFLMGSELSSASQDSMRTQIEEVIAAALEEKQIDVPDAEVYDYGVTIYTEFY